MPNKEDVKEAVVDETTQEAEKLSKEAETSNESKEGSVTLTPEQVAMFTEKLGKLSELENTVEILKAQQGTPMKIKEAEGLVVSVRIWPHNNKEYFVTGFVNQAGEYASGAKYVYRKHNERTREMCEYVTLVLHDIENPTKPFNLEVEYLDFLREAQRLSVKVAKVDVKKVPTSQGVVQESVVEDGKWKETLSGNTVNAVVIQDVRTFFIDLGRSGVEPFPINELFVNM